MATSDRTTPERFFYADNGQRRGPVTAAELRQLAASGKLGRSDMVWQEGVETGVPASRVRGLFAAAPSESAVTHPAGFFYSRQTDVFGPISSTELKRLASEGAIWPEDLVWKEGTNKKVPAASVRGLFEKVPAPPRSVGAANRPVEQPNQSPTRSAIVAGPSPPHQASPLIRVTYIADVFQRGLLGLFHGYQIVAVVDDALKMARSVRFPQLQEADCTPIGISRYLTGCSLRATIPFATVVNAGFFGTVHKTFLGKLYPRDRVELRLRTPNGRTRVCFHRRDTANVYEALKLQLRERLSPDVQWRSNGPGLVMSAFIFLVLLILFSILTASILDSVGPRPGSYAALVVLLLSFALSFLCVYLLRRALRRDYTDQMPLECLSAPVWPRRRSTGGRVRQPFRSKLAGYSLKLLGFAWLLLLIFYFPAKVRSAMPLGVADGGGADSSIGQNFSIPQAIAFLSVPSVVLLYLGHGIARAGAIAATNTDSRRQIIYLRSFCLDGKTTLQPESALAAFLGVSGAGSLKAWFSDILVGMNLFVNTKFVQCVHPLRLARLFFGTVADSTEQSLARFFSSFGPVFAIGKPGERIAETGAVREYVADDEWQNVVLQRLQQCQAVILQPIQSLGMKWELETVFRLIALEKILIVFAKGPGLANDYEDLRVFFQQTLSLTLPSCLPYRGLPVVVWFERDRSVRWTELSYRSPGTWLFTGDAVDLEYTLRPFLQGLHGGERELPRPVRRHAWYQQAVGWGFVAIWLAGFGTLVSGGTLFRSSVPAYVSSNVRTISGLAFPFAVDIPESWTPRVASAPGIEQELLKPGVGIIKIAAHQGQEDLTQLAEVAVARTKTQMGELGGDVVVEMVQPRLIGDRSCVEMRVRNEYRTGASEYQRIIAYSGTDGSVLLNVTCNANVTLAQEQEVRRILDSLRFLQSFADVQASKQTAAEAIPAEAATRLLTGKAAPYELRLPIEWVAVESDGETIEHTLRTPSGGMVYVVASGVQEDVSGIGEQLLAQERQELGDEGTASLESSENVTINGNAFTLVKVVVRINTGSVVVVVRCAAHSGDAGTVLVKGVLIDNTNTVAEQVALEEAIRSIRVGIAAGFDSDVVALNQEVLPGDWTRVGPPGAWKATRAGVVLNDQIFTVEENGGLFATDPGSGGRRQIGRLEFAATMRMFAVNDALYTIEADGSLYQVDTNDGTWRRIGTEGVWVRTRAGATLDGQLYTVEENGELFVTNPANWQYRQIGNPVFGATTFMSAANGQLYTIETDGSLYRVDPNDGSWVGVGQAGAWKQTSASAVVNHQLVTAESDGTMRIANLDDGTRRQIGAAEFGNTVFMFASGGQVYTIEADGSLYRVFIEGQVN